MRKTYALAALLILAACNTPQTGSAPVNASTKDTLPYPFKATYSSDITVPGSAQVAHEVLDVWKAFESNDIKSKRASFADTVVYDDASGFRFNGPADSLLAFAGQDIRDLDSLRFDISAWQSAHVNDKNQDWVNIWSTERRYPKKGKPDTSLIQENWMVANGKIVYFNQFKAHLPK